MRNSDDAKLIARAIKEGAALIASAIEKYGRHTIPAMPTYQIPERANDQILFRNSLSSCSADNETTGAGDDPTGDDTAE